MRSEALLNKLQAVFMILFIDNYDSFTYILADMFGQLELDLTVVRNDKISLERIEEMQPEGIVISPGPGRPEDAGISCSLIEKFHRSIPIFGVCLGHQCIGQVFGGKIIRGAEPVHGKITEVFHNKEYIYRKISVPFPAARYHSLIIDKDSVPECLRINAETADGIIMGVRHKKYPVTGVQFHPESILTKAGAHIIKNWTDHIQKQAPTYD